MRCLILLLLLLTACVDLSPFRRPKVEIITRTLAPGTVGAPYSQILRARGGNGVFMWKLRNGVLPDGLTLDSLTGEISGIPTTETPPMAASLVRVYSSI